MFLFVATVLLFVVAFNYLSNRVRRAFVKDFHDKNVFITGTDTGFGRTLALDLDSRGLTVYAGCYSEQGVASLRREASDRMRVLRLDVTDNDSVLQAKRFVESDIPAGKGLWAVVNNAGVLGTFVIEWASIADYMRTMDVNFFGIVRVTNAFLPLVKKAGGRIVNVSSMAGRLAVNLGPYDCSKFAMEAFSDNLRRNMARCGVKVSTIEPGFFLNSFVEWDKMKGILDDAWAVLPEEARAEFGGEKERLKIEKVLTNVIRSHSSTNVRLVIDSMRHAIGSRFPKARYICGYDAKYLFVPMSMALPDWLLDVILRAIVNSKKNV